MFHIVIYILIWQHNRQKQFVINTKEKGVKMPEENREIISVLRNKKYTSSGLNFPKRIMHFDLCITEIYKRDENKIYEFVSKNNGVYFQNFLLPKEIFDSNKNIFNSNFSKDHLEELFELLSKTEIYYSPVICVTWEGTNGGRKFNEVKKLFTSLIPKLTNSSGYLEIKEVNQRYKFKGNDLITERNPLDFSVKNLKVERLRHSDFWETEVSVSFSNIKKIHPKIIINLIRYGFSLAFRKIKNNLSLIATIRGYELEISMINFKLLDWLVRETHKGSLNCEIVIKKSNIFAYKIFGDPKLQMVIKRNSLLL